MNRKFKGLAIFGGAAALAFGIYGLTLPDGLPWGVAERVPGAWCLVLCALAAGCLGAVANRYFGWKIGAAAAIAWTFFPCVWDGAILGGRMAAYAALGAIGLWVLNAIVLSVFRKAIAVHHSASKRGLGTLADAGVRDWRMRLNYLSGWVFLGAVGIFAIASLWLHDYKLGEPASVYARGVVESVENGERGDKGERIIVLNGVADEQVVREVEKRGGGGQRRVLSLVKDDAYREEALAWAREEWPTETNLWVAAHVGVSAFLDAAIKAHPERFYLMNGESTTPEQWERRWAAFEPYLKSSDKFVRVGRRLFAIEGNAVGNALQETDKAAAWKLYGRIANEVDRDNISALVNMGEMIRKGYKVTEREEADFKKRCDAFLSIKKNRRYARELVQMAGPVKADPELLAKMAEARRERVEEAKARGEKLELTQEAKDLIEQNDAMVVAMERGDLETAGKIARKILSNPQWRGWVPANAMLGNVAASKGDYAEAEAFYRAATSGKNETPEVVWNNYADTLMRLGNLDEAEAILRRQIAKTDEKTWALRFTLAEVLTKKVKVSGPGQERIEKEVRELVASVMKNAPPDMIRLLREKQRSGDVLK